MPFREKCAWISLLANVGVYGWYYWTFYKLAQAGQGDSHAYIGPLIGSVVAIVVVHIVLTAIVAIQKPKEANAALDEREKLINLKSARVGFYVVTLGALIAAGYGATGIPAAYLVNGVFLAVVLGEAARNLAQIAYFRMGA